MENTNERKAFESKWMKVSNEFNSTPIGSSEWQDALNQLRTMRAEHAEWCGTTYNED